MQAARAGRLLTVCTSACVLSKRASPTSTTTIALSTSELNGSGAALAAPPRAPAARAPRRGLWRPQKIARRAACGLLRMAPAGRSLCAARPRPGRLGVDQPRALGGFVPVVRGCSRPTASRCCCGVGLACTRAAVNSKLLSNIWNPQAKARCVRPSRRCRRVAAPDGLKSERICTVTYQLVRPHLYDLPRPPHGQHVSHARQMRQNRCMQPLLAARALKSALVVAHAIRMPQRGRPNDASRGPRVSALRLPRGRQADGMQ